MGWLGVALDTKPGAAGAWVGLADLGRTDYAHAAKAGRGKVERVGPLLTTGRDEPGRTRVPNALMIPALG